MINTSKANKFFFRVILSYRTWCYTKCRASLKDFRLPRFHVGNQPQYFQINPNLLKPFYQLVFYFLPICSLQWNSYSSFSTKLSLCDYCLAINLKNSLILKMKQVFLWCMYSLSDTSISTPEVLIAIVPIIIHQMLTD